MSIVQFIISIGISLLLSVYTFNFASWLWRRQYRLGAVGATLLMIVFGGGSVLYFVIKLLA